MATLKNGSIKLDVAALASGEGEKLKAQGYALVRTQKNGHAVFAKPEVKPENRVFADTTAAKAGLTEADCSRIYKLVVEFRQTESEALKNGGERLSPDEVREMIAPDMDKSLFWAVFKTGKAIRLANKAATAPAPVEAVKPLELIPTARETVEATAAKVDTFDHAKADSLAQEQGFKHYRALRKFATSGKPGSAAVAKLREVIGAQCRKVA